jgi:hypothetical protein
MTETNVLRDFGRTTRSVIAISGPVPSIAAISIDAVESFRARHRAAGLRGQE